MDAEVIEQLVDSQLLHSIKEENPQFYLAVFTILQSLRFFKGLVEKEGIPFESITREIVIERFLKQPVTAADVLAARERVGRELARLERKLSAPSAAARSSGRRARTARALRRER